MFQDGKIVWVRDGSQYARCSVTRIVSRKVIFEEKDGVRSHTGKLWEDLELAEKTTPMEDKADSGNEADGEELENEPEFEVPSPFQTC